MGRLCHYNQEERVDSIPRYCGFLGLSLLALWILLNGAPRKSPEPLIGGQRMSHTILQLSGVCLSVALIAWLGRNGAASFDQLIMGLAH